MISKIDKNMAATEVSHGIDWYDPSEKPFEIAGLAFFAENNRGKTKQKEAPYAYDFSRMPKAKEELFKKVNPNLVFLGSDPASGQIRFRTNSESVSVKAALASAHDMCNMPASGQCGFDLYVKYDGEKEYTFLGMTHFDVGATEYESCLSDALREGEKSIIVNMPLYSCLLGLAIGVDEGASVSEPEKFGGKPFVFYGTSITQGGCVSRPGTCYVNLIGRAFDREVFNFGFSANGLGEYEMAELIRDLPESDLVVLDYEANAGSNGRLEKLLEGFIRIVREKQKAPVLVLSRIPYILDETDEKFGGVRRRCRAFAKDIVKKFNDEGDEKVYFLDGYELFDEGWSEYTVDLIHPTDVGHIKMAKKIAEKISEIVCK